MNTMLLWEIGITVVLTLANKVSVAINLAVPANLLTLVLYGLMSFTLILLAWKVKKTTLFVVLNLAGIIGTFVGVNFTMDFIRGFRRTTSCTVRICLLLRNLHHHDLVLLFPEER